MAACGLRTCRRRLRRDRGPTGGVGPPPREGADGRTPLYRSTAKLFEVTAAASLEELRQRVMTHGPAQDGDAAEVGEVRP